MLLSVVIPLLNEEGSLPELHRRIAQTTEKLGCERQIIFVDDGSTDGSARVIRELAAQDPSVVGLRFSRNFGHEAASTAGLDAACGDAAILMDADLQDPPELIEQMVRLWQDGNEIVYAVRRRREGEGWFKRSTSWLFYRMLDRLADVSIPKDTGDFRLIDARVLHALRQCRETDRFVRGLVAWTGFRSTSLLYDRPARLAGVTKYNPLRLLLLSLDAAVGFSILPLRIATGCGMAVTLLSLVMVAIIAVQKLLHEMPAPGYALLACGLFFLGGVQMMLLGILGEYIGRIYRQTQSRPLYLVAEKIGATNNVEPSSGPALIEKTGSSLDAR
jgi:dolichol-phosphate mannosyltransferase